MNLSEKDAQTVMNIASEVGALRNENAALRARVEELEAENGRNKFRLAYIKEEISDSVAIRFALEAEDWEIDEKMMEAQ